MQEEEFKWLLQEEVHAVLKQLQDILKVRLICFICFFCVAGLFVLSCEEWW